MAEPNLAALKGIIPLIGLTGGIGSGKSVVANALDALGGKIIDADQIAHQITAPGGLAIPLIQEQFGDHYLTPEGTLDRTKMRSLVFQNPTARAQLEDITHPLIRQETLRQAFEAKSQQAHYLVFVVPLLLESGLWENLLDHLVVVDCQEETQILRVMQRSGLEREEVERILGAQASREERLKHADSVIQNDGSLDSLQIQIEKLHQKILGIHQPKAT